MSLHFAFSEWKLVSVDPHVGGKVEIELEYLDEVTAATFYNPACRTYAKSWREQVCLASTVVIFLMHAPCTTTILKFFATEKIAGKYRVTAAIEVTTDSDE